MAALVQFFVRDAVFLLLFEVNNFEIMLIGGGYNMNKIHILGIFLAGLAMGVSITFLLMNKNDGGSDLIIVKDESNVSASTEIEEIDLSWVDEAHVDMLNQWKNGDKTFSERVIQEVMLHMTHQKGMVDLQDGSIELTSERTDKLIQIIEEDKAILQYYEEYLAILKRWEKGDFSTIYEDHARLHSFYDRCSRV